MSTNCCSRADICFSFKVYVSNYIEHAMSFLLIEYDDNIYTKIEQSGNLVVKDLSYLEYDPKMRTKVD
jgi:hypothetical protein